MFLALHYRFARETCFIVDWLMVFLRESGETGKLFKVCFRLKRLHQLNIEFLTQAAVLYKPNFLVLLLRDVFHFTVFSSSFITCNSPLSFGALFPLNNLLTFLSAFVWLFKCFVNWCLSFKCCLWKCLLSELARSKDKKRQGEKHNG